jgi:hypothetical protein
MTFGIRADGRGDPLRHHPNTRTPPDPPGRNNVFWFVLVFPFVPVLFRLVSVLQLLRLIWRTDDWPAHTIVTLVNGHL